MKHRKLGSSQVEVSAVAQGTTGFGTRERHDPALVARLLGAIRSGIDHGITFIDTAELYGGGFTEESLGPAIADVRQRIFLASKFSAQLPDTGQAVTRSLDASLKRLRTDYLDLYQLHYPNPYARAEEIYGSLLAARQAGKIRFIGVSNFTVSDLAEAKSYLGENLASVQCEYNSAYRAIEADVLPYCRENRITILAYGALGQGRLAGGKGGADRWQALAAKYRVTPQQLLIAWVLRDSNIVAVTKSSSGEHHRQNAAATELALTPGDADLIAEATRVEIVYIEPAAVNPDSTAGKETYADVDAARRNTLNLAPSPGQLALHASRHGGWKPVKVVRSRDANYRYELAPYDHFGELRKYWAWVLAFGYERPIPAMDVSEAESRDKSLTT